MSLSVHAGSKQSKQNSTSESLLQKLSRDVQPIPGCYVVKKLLQRLHGVVLLTAQCCVERLKLFACLAGTGMGMEQALLSSCSGSQGLLGAAVRAVHPAQQTLSEAALHE
jgi:hypothetical protein